MRVTIAAVGRDRSGAARELFDEYCRRCSWPIRLVEIAPRSALPHRAAPRGPGRAPGGRDPARCRPDRPRRTRAPLEQPLVRSHDRRLAATGSKRAGVPDRRSRRPGGRADRARRPGARARADDLAAPSGAGAACRAALSRQHDPGGASLSSGVARFRGLAESSTEALEARAAGPAGEAGQARARGPCLGRCGKGRARG